LAIAVAINPDKCPRLVRDLLQVKRADNGDIDKVTDRKLSHASDAYGYLVFRVFPIRSKVSKLLDKQRVKKVVYEDPNFWTEAG
jgi:polyhydroxyalkanoate synthesis regulator phasin